MAYGKKLGGNLASRTTSSVFEWFSWNFAQMFALGCKCARHIFWQWQKVCCHGNGILWQKIAENLASRTTTSVLKNSHEILHRCLPWGVNVQDTFFDSGRKCVAMVTAYYGKTIGGKLNYLHIFKFKVKFGPHVGREPEVDEQYTFFDNGLKCVAMVTTYGKKWGKLCGLNYFHIF